MCLSKPQRVIKVEDGEALVEFMETKKVIKTRGLGLKPGDYVLCQGGFVVHKISQEKAEEIMKEWKEFSLSGKK